MAATAVSRFDDDASKVISNLTREVNQIEGRTLAGLKAAGLQVQRVSQKMVPVEYGNLRASAYTRKAEGGGLAVEVGYSASYAVYVHENMEMKLKGDPRPSGLGEYWGPQGQPKFLLAAVQQVDIVGIVKGYARVKR